MLFLREAAGFFRCPEGFPATDQSGEQKPEKRQGLGMRECPEFFLPES